MLETQCLDEKLISLVVPVFNEVETVGPFIDNVSIILSTLKGVRTEFVFVDDGSSDGTLEVLTERRKFDERIRIVELSRNFGKEAALTAGLDHARGDAVIPIDVDLQDPPEFISDMVEKWSEGFEVVLARRIDRQADSWAKRATANWFYRIHNKIAQPKIPENVGDFRLLDRIVVDALKQLPESRRFMKGLFAWVGFKTTQIEYIRPERFAGTTKFNGWKLWNFALEGITSFSTSPLRMWTYIGFSISFMALSYALYIASRVIARGVDVPGYASLIVSVMFFGGLQLMGIGILGEYLGRTYIESKRRPTYLVRRLH